MHKGKEKRKKTGSYSFIHTDIENGQEHWMGYFVYLFLMSHEKSIM